MVNYSVLDPLPKAGRICLLLLLLLPALLAQAANYQSHSLEHQSLIIQTDEGRVTLTAFSADALEVFYQPDGVKQLPSFALAGSPEPVEVMVSEQADKLVLLTPNLRAEIFKHPLRIRYLQDDRLLLEGEAGLFVQDTIRGFRFRLQPGEKLMGGGQRVLGMDRRGQRMPLYNQAHYGYTTESSQMYFSLPAVLSDRKYALVFDNSARGWLDIGHSDKDILQFDASGGRTAYVIVAGQSYPDLVSQYTRVTGRQPLPPRWALGNFASRFGYRSQQQTLETVEAFNQQDMPVDAIVLDLYWFGPDIQGHMGNLDWDRKAFPDPEGMIAQLQQQNVKTVLITEPFILSSSSMWESAEASDALATNQVGKPRRFDFYFGNTGLVDVFSDRGRQWFGQAYKRLHQQGVAGWWGDLGEPEVHPADSLHDFDGQTVTGDEIHNAYGHQWAKMVFEQLQQLAPEQRPMLLMRAGFAGSQRYGMIPWTGDVSRSWGGLKPQVELSLQMSMLGLAYTHSDLGGFAGGEAFDRELYIRWLQFGVFQPVYRPHAQEQIAPEPVFHDELTRNITREYIKLRYRLLPYNYSLAYENSLTGLPLMRPMMFEDETRADWFDEKEQYMWGEAFLVKPVTSPGTESVQVTLPAGVWFDFWNDQRYRGNSTVNIATQLDHLPVLVRGGAFVPMTRDILRTQDYDPANLILHYYPDAAIARSTGRLYEDDGENPSAISDKQFVTLDFTGTYQEGAIKIDINQSGKYKGMPQMRGVTLVMHNQSQAPESVMLGDRALANLHPSQRAGEREGFYFDQDKGLLSIVITHQQISQLTVHLAED